MSARLWTIAALLGLLVWVGAAASCGEGLDSADKREEPLQVQIISPHGSDIRREFGEAFAAWHEAKFGQKVAVVWPDVGGGGGTGNVVRTLQAAYDHGDSSGYDLVWGGGSATFRQFAAARTARGTGFLEAPPPITPEELARAGWVRDPIEDVPADIFGNPLHGEGWVAGAMSSFGMSINKQRIAELGLKTPTRWEDMATPEWFGLLSLADPAKSGSVKTSYEMILQQYGWERGWAMLVRLFANTAVIREGGANPGDDVGNAEAVGGIVIDFYGRLQILRAGEGIVGFVVPAGGTVLDADPIALLKGAPQRQIAARFMRFVVSPEGQRLWVLRAGVPGGPRRTALGRLAVLPRLYEDESAGMLEPTNPFASPAAPLRFDAAAQQSRNAWLGELIKAALIDNRPALVRARGALRDAGDPADLIAEFEGVPTYVDYAIEGGALRALAERPMDSGRLTEVAREYSPPRGDPRADYAERLQSILKDHWRTSFAKRFADAEKSATSRMANQGRLVP